MNYERKASQKLNSLSSENLSKSFWKLRLSAITYGMKKTALNRIHEVLMVTLLLLSVYGLSAQSRLVKVGVWSNYPVIFQDKDSIVKGFYIDLLEKVGKKENIQFKYVVANWDACLDNIRFGRIDLLPGTGYFEERVKYADYSKNPVLTIWGELYALKASEINGILDISNKKIGVVKSDIITNNFKELVLKFNIHCQFVEFGVYNDVFDAIASGAVDAGIAEVTFGWLKKDEFGLRSTGVVFAPMNYYFITPKGKNADLIQILDRHLSVWKGEDNSFLDQSKEKWLRGMVSTIIKKPPWLVDSLVLLALAIITAIIFIVMLKLKVERATRTIRQGEIMLRESNTYLKTVMDSINDAVFVHDADTGNIVDVNKSMCEMYGYTLNEVLNITIADISQGDPPYSQADAMERMRKSRENGPQTFEWLAKHRDGHVFWSEVSISFAVIGKSNRFVVVARDISDRKEAEINLIKAKEHAEESDRLKTAFLQNMSHEIRTPMNAIMGFSNLIIENIDDKSSLKKFSNIIVERCSDLLDIINDILDISKIESGQLDLHIEECDMIELFAELRVFFAEQQIRFGKEHIVFNMNFNADNTFSAIKTDKVKLKQILINLIGNAFKFTSKGTIECGCKIEGKHLLFYVSDTGIGIPQHDQRKVFERFSQVHNTSVKNIGGTGLGLPIAKGLANMLGGEMWLKSEPNIGTTVSFTIKYIKSNSRIHEQAIGRLKQGYDLQNKTLLIVEDDLYNTEYLKVICKNYFFKIITTEFGKDAIQIAISQPVDLVLMDIRIPDMSGYDATRLIKQYKPDLKIIAQTAYAAKDEREKALEAGCSDYISKPIKPDKLLAMLNI
jgi:PAS domain S-box-containing protein